MHKEQSREVLRGQQKYVCMTHIHRRQGGDGQREGGQNWLGVGKWGEWGHLQ